MMATEEPKTEDTDVVLCDFTEILKTVNKGHSPFELSQALDKVVERVRATGKPGKVVYTMTVQPELKTESQVSVTDDIDVKLPKGKRFASLYFASKEKGLTREDPNQMSLPQM